MCGGAAIAASIISDIKKSVEKAVDNSGLDDVMDTAASIDADAAKGELTKKELEADTKAEETRAKEIVDVLALDAYYKNRKEIAAQVERILSEKVRDILPAVDVLAKEIDRAQNKELDALDAYTKKITFSYFRRNLKTHRDAMIAAHEKTDNWIKTTRANIAKITNKLDQDEYIDFIKINPENELSNLRARITDFLVSLFGALASMYVIYTLANESKNSKDRIVFKSYAEISIGIFIIMGAYGASIWRRQWLLLKQQDKYK
jgi:hypothetical protein